MGSQRLPELLGHSQPPIFHINELAAVLTYGNKWQMCSSVCLFATPAIWSHVKVVSESHGPVYETEKIEGMSSWDGRGTRPLSALLATVVCTVSGKLIL